MWASSSKKRGYRCGVTARSVAIDGVIVTAEDKSRIRLTRGRGVHGDNIIAQKSRLYVSSNSSEWSHPWAMRKPKK